MGKNTPQAATSLTASLTSEARIHITAMTISGLLPHNCNRLLAATSAIPVLVMAVLNTTVAPNISNKSHSIYFVTFCARQHFNNSIAPAANIVVAIKGMTCNEDKMNIITRIIDE